MEKGNAIKWTLVLVAIVVVGFAGMKIFGSFSATGNDVQDSTTPTTPTQTAPTGEVKEFTMTAKKWDFSPSTITVNKGDTVKLYIKSIDVTHGFGLPDFGVNENLPPGERVNVEFVADKTGTFTFECTVYCGSGHSGMKGQLIVQ